MNKGNKTELFEEYPIPKAVATLAVPTVLSCLVMVLYNLADTFFVGQLNDPIQTGAVTLAGPVILAFNAVINLAGTGCSSLMSRALGVKDYDTVRRTSAFGFYMGVFAGALFSLLCTVCRVPLLRLLGADETTAAATTSYMFWTVTCGAIPSIVNVVTAQLVRAEGMALHAGIGTMGGCLMNILLDPVFILPWGLNMGAAGAGCATFISNTCACLYYVILVRVKKGSTLVSMNIKDLRPNRYIVGQVFSVGVPAAIQNLLNVTGMTVLNNFMSAYGSAAISASGIAHKLAMIPMYISMGISQGVMPLVGYNFASGNRKRMREALLYAGKIAIAIPTVMTVLACIFSHQIIGLFMKNPEVVELGGAFLIGQSLAQPFLGMDFFGVGVFQACGMGKKSLVFAIMRKAILEIPALIILNKLFPMYGLAYAAMAAEIVLAAAAVIELKKIMWPKGAPA